MDLGSSLVVVIEIEYDQENMLCCVVCCGQVSFVIFWWFLAIVVSIPRVSFFSFNKESSSDALAAKKKVI